MEIRNTAYPHIGRQLCNRFECSLMHSVLGQIEKANVTPMCRMCNKAEETLFHIVSESSMMAQTEYKGRYDKLAKVIHWDLCLKRMVSK